LPRVLIPNIFRNLAILGELDKASKSNELPEIVESDQKLSRWVVVIDEYADLMSEPEVRKNIETKVKRIAQKARASGIHLIIGTQRPSADNISTTVRSNLPAQLALSAEEQLKAGLSWGSPGLRLLMVWVMLSLENLVALKGSSAHCFLHKRTPHISLQNYLV